MQKKEQELIMSIKEGIRNNKKGTNNKDNPTPEWLKKNSLDFEITGRVDNAISFEEPFYSNGEVIHAKSKNGIFNIDNALRKMHYHLIIQLI